MTLKNVVNCISWMINESLHLVIFINPQLNTINNIFKLCEPYNLWLKFDVKITQLKRDRYALIT